MILGGQGGVQQVGRLWERNARSGGGGRHGGRSAEGSIYRPRRRPEEVVQCSGGIRVVYKVGGKQGPGDMNEKLF